MDLKDFISASLLQIIEGVKNAQAEAGGDNINAAQFSQQPGGNIIHAGEYGLFSRVDFDVAVSAETAGKGGVDLKVFGVGIGAGADKKATAANCIVFSVPVRLPYGDQNVAKEISDRRAAAEKERQERRARSRNTRTSFWME
ncbi:hypothetical protein [Mesorhizobium sp. LjNodule214]|uniref:hypothetical protein n=1 Tax=Mesorhizobium sp. LjNodule214 TaxID=3342252 RepID=UPI003ECD6519